MLQSLAFRLSCGIMKDYVGPPSGNKTEWRCRFCRGRGSLAFVVCDTPTSRGSQGTLSDPLVATNLPRHYGSAHRHRVSLPLAVIAFAVSALQRGRKQWCRLKKHGYCILKMRIFQPQTFLTIKFEFSAFLEYYRV